MKVTLKQSELDLAPGGSTSVDVLVENNGRTTVAPTLDVIGLDGAVPSGLMTMSALAPGESARTTLTLTLPADAVPGDRRVAVVAQDATGASHGAAHVTLRTGSASQVSMHVSPREQRAKMRARFKINLHNHGETPIDLHLSGAGEGLRLKFKPAQLMLPVGHSVRVRAKVRSTRPALFRERRRPFMISAQGTGTPVAESGSFTQFTLIPGKMFRSLALLLVFAMFASGAYAAKQRYGDSAKKTAAAATAAKATTTVATTATTKAAAGTKPGAAATPAAAASPAGAPEAAVGADVAAGAAIPTATAGGVPTIEKAIPTNAVATPAAAVISGTVNGPSNLAGIPVVLQRVSLGDVSTTRRAGKLPAQGANNPLSGEVLSEQRSVTDVGGRFRFAGNLAVPGIYRVSAALGGYEKASVIASLTPDVPASEIVIGLVPATGRLSGKVVDANGIPVGDATITVKDGDLTYTARTASQGDTTGVWSIDGVHTPTSYLVTAVAAGFASGSMLIELGGGQARGDANLTLVRGLGTVHGLVSSRGVGVGGITMELRAVEGDTIRTTTTLTDASLAGSFTLTNLPLGRYAVTLSGEGWLTQTRQILLDSGDLLVDISDLRKSTAVVQGRVFQMAGLACSYPAPGATGSLATAQPCGNVGVTVQSDQGAWRTTSTSGTGAFAVAGVPAGTFTVRLERYGYTPAILTVTVGAGDIATIGPVGATGVDPIVLELSLTGGGTNSAMRAVLRDDQNPTIPLDVLCLHPAITVTESTGLTSAVLLAGDGDPTACASSAVSMYGSTLSPSVGGRTSFQPCPAGDAPIPGSGARACFATGGGVRIEGLAPGAKTVTVSADGFDQSVIVAQVPATGYAELGLIRLLPLASLSGQISGANDSPVSRARIFVTTVDKAIVIPNPPASTDGDWYSCSIDVDHTGVPVAGLCAEASVDGQYRFGRSLRSASYKVYAPVGDVIAASSPGSPPAMSLDHDRITRDAVLQAGQSTTLDLRVRRFGAIGGVIQTPDNTGTNFALLGGVQVAVTTTGGIANSTRTTIGTPTGDLTEGRYRVDRLLAVDSLKNEGYHVVFSKAGFDDAVVEVPGGVAFNQELLRNVIMIPRPVAASGHVVWRPDPAAPTTRPAIADVKVHVEGITSYTLVDAPPFVVPVHGSYDAVTDANGAFSDPAATDMLFAAGKVTITATEALGFVPSSVDVPLAAAANAILQLEPSFHLVTGKTTLTPTVLAGEPTTAASIWSQLVASMLPPSGGTPIAVSLTSTGEFVIPSIRPDTRPYTLTISGPGIARSVTSVLVPPSDADTVVPTITLTRRGQLTVSVRDNGGVNAAGTDLSVGVGKVTVELWKAGVLEYTAISCVDPASPGGVRGCAAGTVVFDDLDLSLFDLKAHLTGWVSVAMTGIDLRTQAVQSIRTPALIEYGKISGTVRGKVSSTAAFSSPIPNAKITATPTTGTAVVAYAGNDGTFTVIGDMPAGSWDVAVTAPGYGDQAVGAFTIANAATTAVGDVTLTAVPSILTGVVTLTGSSGTVTLTATVLETGVTATFVGTTYTFPAMAPQGYTIEFKADDNRSSLTRLITLRPGETQHLDVTMGGPVGKIFGIVQGADAADALGTDLAGVSVKVLKLDTSQQGSTVTTDAGGNFTFEDVPIGSYNVEFSAPGYATVTRPVTIAAKASVYLSATLIAVPSSLTATVTSSAGGTLGSVQLTAIKGGKTVQVATATNGTAVLSSLSPGTWTMSASNAASAVHSGVVDPHANRSLPDLIVPKSTGTLPAPSYVLDRYEGMTFTVLGQDIASGTTATLTGATISATPPGGGTPVVLPSTYAVRAPLAAGVWDVSVTAPGYDPVSTTATVVADGIVSGSATLTATVRSVTVAVASSAGPALVGVDVLAKRNGATTGVTVPTNASGNAVFASLAPGTWTFETTNATTLVDLHADKTSASIVVAKSPTAAPAPTLTLDRYESITLTLTGKENASATPAAVTGATVTLTGPGVTTAVTMDEVTATPGTYTLRTPMAAGSWSVKSVMAGFDTLTTSVTLAADQQATVSAVMVGSAHSADITLTSSATGLLSGVGVTATLRGATGVTASGTTVAGVVTLSLAPGKWDLVTSGAVDATIAGAAAPHEDKTGVATIPVGGAATVAVGLTLTAASIAVTGQVVSTFPGGDTVNLSGASISYTRTGGLTTYTAVSTSTGTFATSLPPSKTWASSVSAASHTTTTGSLVTGATAAVSAGTISLKRLAASITGHVTLETLATPVGGVKIEARALGKTPVVASAVSAADGAYLLPGLDPNVTWEVTFDSRTSGDAAVHRQPLTHLVSPAAGGSTITLDHVVAQFAGSIKVDIVGALQGQAGVAAALTGTPTIVITDDSTTPSINPVTLTATGGTATLTDVPARTTFKVSVTNTNWGDASGNAVAVEQSAVTVTNGVTTTITITLYPLPRSLNVTLLGATVGTTAGAVVPGAKLVLSGGGISGTGISATTDSTTGVAAFTGVPASPSGGGGATYSIGISMADGSIVAGSSTGINIPLGAAATPVARTEKLEQFDITVKDSAAAAITDAVVTAKPTGGTAIAMTNVGAGLYRLVGVLSGVWTISADGSASGHVTATPSVTAVADTAVTSTITLAFAPRTLSVTVKSAATGNALLTGVTVVATPTPSGTAVTGPTVAGVVSLSLLPGTYSLTTTGATGLTDPHVDATGTAVTIAATGTVPPSTLTLNRYEGLSLTLTGKQNAGATAVALTGASVVAGDGTTTHTLVETPTGSGIYLYRGVLTAATTWTLTVTKTDYDNPTTAPSLIVAANTVTTSSLTMMASTHAVVVTVNLAAPGPDTPIVGSLVTASMVGETDVTGTTAAASDTTVAGVTTLQLRPGTWTLVTSGGLPLPTTEGSHTLVVPVSSTTATSYTFTLT
jgi:large repetitive protein